MGDVNEPSDHDHCDPPDAGSDVGSVGEEAAKLLGALSDWAKDSGGDVGGGVGATLSGLGGLASGMLGEVNDHLATGSAECTYCPVCRAVHAVRGTSPEVKAHLATAASSFFQAVAAVLATVPPRDSSGTTGAKDASGGLERIDLDDEDGDDDD